MSKWTELKGRISATRLVSIMADAATNVLSTISYPHHEIHAGDAYKLSITTADLDSEGANNALHFKIITPNTAKWGHITYDVWASGEGTWNVTEAPSGGMAGGSPITPINKNRNSTNTSGMVVSDDDTTPVGGTVIDGPIVLGVGNNKVSSEASEREEFVLKQNTTYSFRLISVTNLISARVTLNWYEHTDEN